MSSFIFFLKKGEQRKILSILCSPPEVTIINVSVSVIRVYGLYAGFQAAAFTSPAILFLMIGLKMKRAMIAAVMSNADEM